MSYRNRKVKSNLDYAILHNTGKKVNKADKTKMDLGEKNVTETQISEDITESFAIFDLQDLDTEQEISEGREQISELGRQYRHIHVELKASMGMEAHTNAYKNYSQICENIRTYVKNSKGKIKLIKKEEKEEEEMRLEEEKMVEEDKLEKARKAAERKARESLRIEEQVFQERLEREIEGFELNESEEIKSSCGRFELLLDEYYRLLSKVKIRVGDEFETEWKENFDNTFSRISAQIKKGKSKIKVLSTEEEENITKVNMQNDKLLQDSIIKEQKFHAGILCKEIEMRCASLVEKCDISELENMSDHRILECHTNLSSIDLEMREIFERVTDFSKIAALCGNEKDQMLIKPRNLQEKTLEFRNTYAIKLHSIFTEREISEEKLKNSTSLTID